MAIGDAFNGGGATPYLLISAATTNATTIKNGQGQVYGAQVFNNNAAARYLKFYDKSTSPVVGTDVPVKVLEIPGATAGSGAVPTFILGVLFVNGISIATTTGYASTDTGVVGLGDLIINIDFK